MYCPQCGQQQVSDVTRFCSRCGFLLDGVATVLATGGAVPTQYVRPAYKPPSPQSKGIRQGALLMLSTILVVPLLSVISVVILGHPEIIVPITAMICFIGGLLRILYALLMEEAAEAGDEEESQKATTASGQEKGAVAGVSQDEVAAGENVAEMARGEIRTIDNFRRAALPAECISGISPGIESGPIVFSGARGMIAGQRE